MLHRVAKMCKIMEDMRKEAAKEKVSDCFPDLPDSDIKELETEIMQLV